MATRARLPRRQRLRRPGRRQMLVLLVAATASLSLVPAPALATRAAAAAATVTVYGRLPLSIGGRPTRFDIHAWNSHHGLSDQHGADELLALGTRPGRWLKPDVLSGRVFATFAKEDPGRPVQQPPPNLNEAGQNKTPRRRAVKRAGL